MIPSVEYEQIDIGSGEKEQKIIVKTTCLGTDIEWFTKPNNFGVKVILQEKLAGGRTRTKIYIVKLKSEDRVKGE